jgi:hypothetical protein
MQGILQQSVGARESSIGIVLSYRPTKLHTTQDGGIDFVNRFLGSFKVLKYCLWFLITLPIIGVRIICREKAKAQATKKIHEF